MNRPENRISAYLGPSYHRRKDEPATPTNILLETRITPNEIAWTIAQGDTADAAAFHDFDEHRDDFDDEEYD